MTEPALSKSPLNGLAPVGHNLAPQTVEASLTVLAHRICSLRAPRIVGEADGTDMRAIAEHMVEIADAVDAYFTNLGHMVQSNSPVKIAMELFEHPCFGAIGGEALFEISRAAEALDQDRVL